MFILLVILIISFPIKVKAYCDYQELSRLKNIASNINYKIDYIEKDNKVEFTITLVNLHPEIYIRDVSNNKFYYYSDVIKGKNELVLKGYSSGKTIRYDIYNNIKEFCDSEVLLSKYVTLPPYNPYYKDPICSGAEEYKLCQKWINMNMNYNNFKKEVENYKIMKDKKPIEEPVDEQPKDINIILGFYMKYYIYILSSIIIGCLVWIYFLRKKDNLDFS